MKPQNAPRALSTRNSTKVGIERSAIRSRRPSQMGAKNDILPGTRLMVTAFSTGIPISFTVEERCPARGGASTPWRSHHLREQGTRVHLIRVVREHVLHQQ